MERREDETLVAQAAKSARSRGRLRPEVEDDVRPAFQHDRDRIIHSKAFRRLKHKTQVFFAPAGDHYRTRLTHTLEVSQIARTIAKVLRLHEELTEAIALGHDLGHTPFDHTGERVLDGLVPGGFRHYEQSLRVVDVLENDGQGLNLTFEVRDGIGRHSKGKQGSPVGLDPEKRSATLVGQIMRVADLIAYVNHDIDDAIRAGVLVVDQLPKEPVRLLGATGQVRQLIRRERIGVVFGSGGYIAAPAILAARWCGIPVVLLACITGRYEIRGPVHIIVPEFSDAPRPPGGYDITQVMCAAEARAGRGGKEAQQPGHEAREMGRPRPA